METLPDILSPDEGVELQGILQSITSGEEEEFMLAKYIMAKMFVHEKLE